jgi:phage shock protein A
MGKGGDESDARIEELKQALSGLLDQVRQALTDLERDAAQLQSALTEATREMAEWERRAVMAVRENKDEIARDALMHLQRHTDKGKELQGELDSLQPYIAGYRETLAELEKTTPPPALQE